MRGHNPGDINGGSHAEINELPGYTYGSFWRSLNGRPEKMV